MKRCKGHPGYRCHHYNALGPSMTLTGTPRLLPVGNLKANFDALVGHLYPAQRGLTPVKFGLADGRMSWLKDRARKWHTPKTRRELAQFLASLDPHLEA